MWLTFGAPGGGYLLGSVSPSYILGRLLRGIDIREHGGGNAGTVNTFAVLDVVPSVVTALFDLGKGLAAMWLVRLLGRTPTQGYLAGLAAIAGHVFPFYLRFRGGQGVATAVGLMLYFLAIALVRGWLLWWHIAVLAGWVAVFASICRRGEMVGVMVLPLLLLLVDTRAPMCAELLFLNLVVAHILLINVYNIVAKKVVYLRQAVQERVEWWRVVLRPGALVFPLLDMHQGQRTALALLGVVLAVSVVADVMRAHRATPEASPHRNSWTPPLTHHGLPRCLLLVHLTLCSADKPGGHPLPGIWRPLCQALWAAMGSDTSVGQDGGRLAGLSSGVSGCLPLHCRGCGDKCLGAPPWRGGGDARRAGAFGAQ